MATLESAVARCADSKAELRQPGGLHQQSYSRRLERQNGQLHPRGLEVRAFDCKYQTCRAAKVESLSGMPLHRRITAPLVPTPQGQGRTIASAKPYGLPEQRQRKLCSRQPKPLPSWHTHAKTG